MRLKFAVHTRSCSLIILLLSIARFQSAQAWNLDNGKLESLRRELSIAKSPNDQALAHNNLGDFFIDYLYPYLDSAIVHYQQALKLTDSLRLDDERLHTLTSLSVAYGKKENWKKCRQTYSTIISWYLSHHQVRKAAEIYDLLHGYFYLTQNINPKMILEAVKFCQEERKLYLKLNDKLGVIKSYKDEGDVNLYTRNLDSSESQLKTALRLSQKVNSKKLHDIYYLLGAVSNLRGDMEKELEYRKKTVASMLATGDTTSRTLFYAALGRTYEQLDQYSQSLTYFKLAQHYEPHAAFVLWHILLDLNKLGRKAEALDFYRKQIRHFPRNNAYDNALFDCVSGIYYHSLGDTKTAQYYYERMATYWDDEIRKAGFNSLTPIVFFRVVTSFYVQIGRFERAAYWVHKLDAVTKISTSKWSLGDIELLKFKVDSGNHRYVSAIKHFEEHKRIMDSIFNYAKARKISDLEVKYVTAAKDKDILILKKQSLLDQEKFTKKATIAEYLVFCVLLLAVVTAVLYSRFALKKRSVHLLKEKQQEITAKNADLEQLLKDNEWLLREVHHRVKNNLHIIMSLLQSQSAFLKDEVAIKAIMESQHRVHAMSLIHQKLYKAEHGTSISMPAYIGELVEYLKQSFKTNKKILFHLQLEPLFLDVNLAVPVGLILNEAITNALKYAFNAQTEGHITIKLSCADDEVAHLSINDDGVGLPDKFNIDTAESFGMQLLRGLAEGDLDGTFGLVQENGTTVMVSFEINPVLN